MGPGRRAAAALLVAAAVYGAAASCASGADGGARTARTARPSSTATPGVGAVPASTAGALCAARPEPGGTVVAAGLDETSGVVASRTHDGVLWAHDDSGGGAEVFALGLDGSDRGRVEVSGAGNVDWEDIALLPGRPGAPDRLLVADIGDNPGGGSRTAQPVRIHRFDEPAPPGAGATAASDRAVSFDVAYADGPRDAEALLADPLTGDVFVVSKQWDGAPAGVYRIPASVVSAPTGPGRVITLDRVGEVATSAGALVTGGDVSADGTAVVLRTYAAVVVWDRDPTGSVADALAGPPACSVPVLELQGEAVAVTADGSGFVTIPEGPHASVLVWRGS
jgi:hypothetical protein